MRVVVSLLLAAALLGTTMPGTSWAFSAIMGLRSGRVVALVTGSLGACSHVIGIEQVRRDTVIEIRVATAGPADPNLRCPAVMKPYHATVTLDGDFPPGEYVLRLNEVERRFRVPIELEVLPLHRIWPPAGFRRHAGWIAYPDATALDDLLPLAEQGQPEAQVAVGNILYQGRGVSKDGPAAAGWYRRAASQGLPIAQFNLGVVLAKGDGVPRNLSEAYLWLTLAVRRIAAEYPQVSITHDTVKSQLTPEEIAAVEASVSTWLPKLEAGR